MSEKQNFEADNNTEEEENEVSLVPLYSPLDVSRGLQAYRRGDAIIYTIRAEPSKVQELMDELGDRGINEVIALVSHRADNGSVKDVTDAIIKTGDSIKEEE